MALSPETPPSAAFREKKLQKGSPTYAFNGRQGYALHALPLLTALAYYAWLALEYYPSLRYHLNSDGTSYITLARMYAHGNWAEALNGYWSPLLSWLLAPFTAFGAGGFATARMIGLLAGAGVLISVWQMGRRMQIPALALGVLLCGLAWVCVWAALLSVTPDLLSTFCLLRLVLALSHPGFWYRKTYAYQAGVWAVLSTFAKAYSLFVATGLLGLFFLLAFWRPGAGLSRRWVLRQGLRTAGIFTLFCGTWVLALSLKYGEFTYGRAGSFNHNRYYLYNWEYPMNKVGLMPPVSPHALSAWDDISAAWQPSPTLFDTVSPARRPQLIRKNLDNLNALSEAWKLPRLLAPLAMLVLILIFWPRWPGRKTAFFLLAAGLLTLTGYVFVSVLERFLWVSLIAAFLLALASGAGLLPIGWRWVRTALLMTLASWLGWQLHIRPKEEMARLANLDKPIWEQAALLQAQGISLKEARLAAFPGQWGEGLALSYLTGSQYYGVLPPDTSAWRTQLQTYPIDWLVSFHQPAPATGSLQTPLKVGEVYLHKPLAADR